MKYAFTFWLTKSTLSKVQWCKNKNYLQVITLVVISGDIIKVGRFQCTLFLIELFLLVFYTASHNSDRLLLFHIGCPCVCPSISIFVS